MDGYGPKTYGDAFADVYDDWYGDAPDGPACIAALTNMAAGGPALELGVGSGRIAIELADHGVAVHGIDASQPMLDLLAANLAAADPDQKLSVTASHTDMADVADLVDKVGPFSLAFATINTFANMTTEAEQLRCLLGCFDLLRTDGVLAIELFIPDFGELAPSERKQLSVRSIELNRVILSATDIDPEEQTISGQHIELTEAGGVKLRPWKVHYLLPEQLDRLAAAAGFVPHHRSADWSGTPYTDASTSHVSLYRRA